MRSNCCERIRPNLTVGVCWWWCGATAAMGLYLSSLFMVARDLETLIVGSRLKVSGWLQNLGFFFFFFFNGKHNCIQLSCTK